ncbi:MAG: hypothetical protein ACRCVI_02585 [Mycoplasmoidaceae bacterium]
MKIKLNYHDHYEVLNPEYLEETVKVGVSPTSLVQVYPQTNARDLLSQALVSFAYENDHSTSKPYISRSQFDLIKATTFLNISKHRDVWNALASGFEFKLYETNIDLNFNMIALELDVIQDSHYPANFNDDVKVSLSLKLKFGYSVINSHWLTIPDLVIGKASEKIFLSVEKVNENKQPIAIALAKIANPALTNNEQYLSEEEFNQILNYQDENATIKNLLSNYFIFSHNLSLLNFHAIVKNFEIQGSYPHNEMSSNLLIMIRINLEEGYEIWDPSLLEEKFIIGKSYNNVSFELGDHDERISVGDALAQVANNDHQDQYLNEEDLRNIIDFASANEKVKSALDHFIKFKINESIKPFDQIIANFVVNETPYPDGNASIIKVQIKLNLNKGYLINHQQELIEEFVVGKTFNKLSLMLDDASENDVANQLALLATGIADNSKPISETQYAKINNQAISKEQPIWQFFNNYFNFSLLDIENSSQPLNLIVKEIWTFGTYPVIQGANVYLTVALIFNKGFTIADNNFITKEFLIGNASKILTSNINEANQHLVGTALATMIDPKFNANNLPMTNAEFLQINNYYSESYDAIWDSVNQYYNFAIIDQQRIANQIFKSIQASGTYPTTDGEIVYLRLTITLNDGYLYEDQSTIVKDFQVGVAIKNLDIVINEANNNLVGNSLAKLAGDKFIDNQQPMTSLEFDQIKNYQPVVDDEIWNELNQYFTFQMGSEIILFNDVIKSILISGTYPDEAQADIIILLKLTFVNGYLHNGSSEISSSFKVGKTYQNLIVESNEANVNLVGIALAKLADDKYITTEQPMTVSEFDKIRIYQSSTSDSIWNELNKYLTFKAEENVLNFNHVIKNITASGTYPIGDQLDLIITLKLSFHDGYFYNGETTISKQFLVGKTYQNLIIENNEANLNIVGTAIAKLADPKFTSNDQTMTSAEFDRVKTYKSSRPDYIWTELAKYYSFKVGAKIIPFNNAIKNIVASGIYPAGNNKDILVTLRLNLIEGLYYQNDIKIIKEFKVGKTFNTLIPLINLDHKISVENALAAIVNKQDNNQVITNAELQTIISNCPTNNNVINAFNNFISFQLDGINQPFHTVVKNIEVITKYYPPGNGVEIIFSLKINLQNGYLVSDLSKLTQSFKIGITETAIEFQKGTVQQKQLIGNELAILAGNNGNYAIISENQFNRINNLIIDYTNASHQKIYNGIKNYFKFTFTGIPLEFQNVIKTIKITGNFQNNITANDIIINVELTLKDQYTTNGQKVVADSFIIGKRFQEAITLVRRPEYRNSVGIVLAQIIDKPDNNQIITMVEYNRIISEIPKLPKDHNLWNQLALYFEFYQSNIKLNFKDVVKDITASASPMRNIADVPLTVNFYSKYITNEGYINASEMFKAGRLS